LSAYNCIRIVGAYHHVAKRAEISPATAIMLAHKAINIELVIAWDLNEQRAKESKVTH
jgi:hypothetical protein